METKYDYLSTAAALNELHGLGYTHDFNIDFDKLFFSAEDYVIDYLYGLRNQRTDEKGVFVVGDLSLVEGKKREIIINLEIKSKSQT